VTSLAYHDADGVRHEVAVRETPAGDWQVLDTCVAETLVIETLDDREDDRPQAEAVARDYVSTQRLPPAEGRRPGEAIPEQGGADAHSDRRPQREAHERGRAAVLSRQAG
jgi:hypothetical protein